MATIVRQKLALKTTKTKIESEKISSSRQIYSLAQKIWDKDSIGIFESCYIVCLNQANMPISWALLSTGGTTGCFMDMKMVLTHALLSGATSIILLHNHPSGNLKPSNADMEITLKAKGAARLLDINLLDHLILAPSNGYYSFADEGML